MRANIAVSEPKPPEDPDSPLAFSMEGFKGKPPASLIANYWSPGWNSVQSLNKFQDEVGGLLSGGSPGPVLSGDEGRRLIETDTKVEIVYFEEIPDAFAPRQDEYLTIPFQHIYGTDGLSRMSPAVFERIPAPYLALNSSLAEKFGLVEGQLAQINLDGVSLHLPARILDSLPKGLIGLPVGLPGIPPALPAWSRVSAGAEGGTE
jgi:NADH-quinone oxidoreductase subunit G